jgi:hypothetical protein
MKIVARTNGIDREAYKVGGKAYKCFPQGSNLAKDAREFGTIEEAAAFLRGSSGWGIRMNPGNAIIYNDISILAD